MFSRFAILIPAVMTPAIIILFIAERRAKQAGILSFAASPEERRRYDKGETSIPLPPLLSRVKRFCLQIDLPGLVLVAASFALLLLPLTLAKTADDGYANGSLFLVLDCCEVKLTEIPL
jgi:hypothetical protein